MTLSLSHSPPPPNSPEPSGSPRITHTHATAHSIFLRWTPPPPDQRNGLLTHYIISIMYNGQQTNVTLPSASEEHTLQARPYSDYILSIAAVNSVGRGPFSAVVDVRTQEDGQSLGYTLCYPLHLYLPLLPLLPLFPSPSSPSSRAHP